MGSDAPVLRAEGLSHVFTSPGGDLRALDDISLQLDRGEFVCLAGPTGCGKTTLLRIMGGLLAPMAGRIEVDGTRLKGPRPDIGFIFQAANLLPWRTVLDNVTLPLEVQGRDGRVGRERARTFIELVGLAGFEEAYPRELSGGMQQRAAIARALVYDPTLLLMDEPFVHLDALTREALNEELLRIWHESGKTIMMVTHNIQEATFLADRVLVMTRRPGRIAREVRVPLSRPRHLDVIYTEPFGELVQQVRDALPQ